MSELFLQLLLVTLFCRLVSMNLDRLEILVGVIVNACWKRSCIVPSQISVYPLDKESVSHWFEKYHAEQWNKFIWEYYTPHPDNQGSKRTEGLRGMRGASLSSFQISLAAIFERRYFVYFIYAGNVINELHWLLRLLKIISMLLMSSFRACCSPGGRLF